MTTSALPDSLSQNIPPHRWVWHSTDESIAAGQTSAFSIIETFCALGLYGWLAFHFEHQWWLLVSAVAAPLLLLRSPQSEKLGVEWLKRYKQQSSLTWDQLDSKSKILLITLSVLFFIFAYTLFFAQINNPTRNSHILSNSFEFMIFYTFTVIYLALIFTTFIGKSSEITLAFFIGPSIFGCITYLALQTDTIAILGVMIGVVISYFLIEFPLKNTNHIIFIIPNIIAGACIALGIWLRSLFIRLLATLYYFTNGFKYIKNNLKEILYLIDLTHLPELIPGSTSVSLSFSIKGNLELIKTNKNDAWLYIILIIFWYPASIMWRWSLKATLWLWFPLTLLLRSPFEGKNLDEVRDITAFRITTNKWLTFVALLIAIWLGSSYLPEIKTWVETLSDTISKPSLKLLEITPPSLGLRQIALWLCCAIAGLLWLSTLKLQTMHKKILEEEDAIHSGIPEARLHLFRQRAHNLERIYTIQVVSFIFLGYSFLLYLAYQWYPQETLHFIPTWLVNYL